MISVFLERTTIAALVSLAVYVVACLPYVITFNMEFSMEISFVQKIFVVSTSNEVNNVLIPLILKFELFQIKLVDLFFEYLPNLRHCFSL